MNFCMKMLVLRVSQLFLIQLVMTGANCALSYEHQGDDWDGMCDAGEKQSPIDVLTNETIKTRFAPFTFMNYDQEVNLEVTNKAHSIKFQIPPPRAKITPPYILGGGLEDNYQFLQGHFHWGSEPNHGSEHKIDGLFSPMEIHLVHWNTRLGNNANEAIASNEYNALAVLSGRFTIGKENLDLKPLFQALSNIEKPGKKSQIREKMKLSVFAPKQLESFFRYNGSLTTPGCNEIVVWTLFKEPIEISEAQFNEICKTKNKKMAANANNYRKVQELNGRKVLDSSSSYGPRIDIFLSLMSILVLIILI